MIEQPQQPTEKPSQATEKTFSNPGNKHSFIKDSDLSDPGNNEILKMSLLRGQLPERVTADHEMMRNLMRAIKPDEPKSAKDLHNGIPDTQEKLDAVRKRFESYAGGDDQELDGHVKELNRQLKDNQSDYRVTYGPKNPEDPSKVTLNLVGLDGKPVPLAEIDRKPLREQRRAEDIADILQKPSLDKHDQVVLENKFKEAFADGGMKAVDDLKKKANEQLKKDDSDLTLQGGTTNNKTVFAVSLDRVNQKTGERKNLIDIDAEDKVTTPPDRLPRSIIEKYMESAKNIDDMSFLKDSADTATTRQLRHQLGYDSDRYSKDNRTAAQIEKADEEKARRSLSADELKRVRSILDLEPTTSDDITRKELAKSLKLPEGARDQEIRQELKSLQRSEEIRNDLKNLMEPPINADMIIDRGRDRAKIDGELLRELKNWKELSIPDIFENVSKPK